MVHSGDAIISAEKRENMKSVLSTLNSFLEGSEWIAGENVTIADISILSNLIVILVSDGGSTALGLLNSKFNFRAQASALTNIPI